MIQILEEWVFVASFCSAIVQILIVPEYLVLSSSDDVASDDAIEPRHDLSRFSRADANAERFVTPASPGSVWTSVACKSVAQIQVF